MEKRIYLKKRENESDFELKTVVLNRGVSVFELKIGVDIEKLAYVVNNGV